MITLVSQSFGKESEYRRAIFSILSFYAHLPREIEQPQTIVFTDNTAFFSQYLKELPVHFVTLHAEKIRRMRGDIDFLHRMKIALIEEAFTIAPGNLVYIDSDTFFTHDPSPIYEGLSDKVSFMHIREYQFKDVVRAHESEETKAFLSHIQNRAEASSAENGEDNWLNLFSWNAGVMILHARHAQYLEQVYQLTEQFFRASKSHASEQYAFSIVLQLNTDLKPCEGVVYHYWQAVKKQIFDLFIKKRMDQNWANISVLEKFRTVKEWTAMLPEYFEKHVINYRNKSIIFFGEKEYLQAYKWAIKALIADPFGDTKFIKDVLYHTKAGIR